LNEFKSPEPEIQVSPAAIVAPEAKTSWATRWKDSSKRWAKETNSAYFFNPTSRRDFRVQFRGSRSVWLFAVYVLFLGVAAIVEYWNISSTIGGAAGGQSRLNEFYQLIVAVLGIAISLVAPAMAATAVVSEKQQRSLDLVFCTPIRPRVYLLGKIVSVFRYTWILLALSLPFTAMSVVLGGASWTDVVATYAMLSLHGVVFTSIGLFYSSISEKAAPALLYTYATVLGYLATTFSLAVLTSMPVTSFFWLLNPFGLSQGLTDWTHVFGLPVPNLVLAAAMCLATIRLLLEAAGTALVKPKPIERARLRLEVAVVYAAVVGAVCYLAPQFSDPSYFGNLTAIFTAPLILFMPFLSSYGFDSENAHRPNGLISWAKTLTGSPAGSITYIWFFVSACFLGGLAAAISSPVFYGSSYLIFFAYTVGFWSFFWALGRAWSSFLIGVKAARVLQLLSFLVVIGAPIPLLAYLSQDGSIDPLGLNKLIGMFWILQPIFVRTGINGAIPWAVFLLVSAPLIALWSEKNLRARLAKKGASLGQIERSTGNFQPE
jgi:ABC-type transport system involved in multi-copper enzyme maturation permease subunit